MKYSGYFPHVKREQYRYPLPPEGIAGRLPENIPWDTPISELSSCWLWIDCSGCGNSMLYPLRLMASNLGWKRTLRTTVPHLRCKHCSAKPSRVVLTADPAGDGGRRGGDGHVLVG